MKQWIRLLSFYKDESTEKLLVPTYLSSICPLVPRIFTSEQLSTKSIQKVNCVLLNMYRFSAYNYSLKDLRHLYILSS